MDDVSSINKLESIKSFQSVISKSENALTQMSKKGSNTTLIKKRLKSLRIGLAVLEYVWYQSPHHYTQEELTEACNVLIGLFPAIEKIYAKLRTGSPQRTLIERRLKAFELAIQAIKETM